MDEKPALKFVEKQPLPKWDDMTSAERMETIRAGMIDINNRLNDMGRLVNALLAKVKAIDGANVQIALANLKKGK